jgi:hypothetical protein
LRVTSWRPRGSGIGSSNSPTSQPCSHNVDATMTAHGAKHPGVADHQRSRRPESRWRRSQRCGDSPDCCINGRSSNARKQRTSAASVRARSLSTATLGEFSRARMSMNFMTAPRPVCSYSRKRIRSLIPPELTRFNARSTPAHACGRSSRASRWVNLTDQGYCVHRLAESRKPADRISEAS